MGVQGVHRARVVALHRELRAAIEHADELGRLEHGAGDDDLAGYLAAVRTVLDELERALGRSHEDAVAASEASLAKMERGARVLRDRMRTVPPAVGARLAALVRELERVVRGERRLQRRSLLGTVLGIVYVAAFLLAAVVTNERRGRPHRARSMRAWRRAHGRLRVPEVQRPLEGLAGPSRLVRARLA